MMADRMAATFADAGVSITVCLCRRADECVHDAGDINHIGAVIRRRLFRHIPKRADILCVCHCGRRVRLRVSTDILRRYVRVSCAYH